MATEAKGMDFDALYPARFVKAGEFGGRDVTLTITAVAVEELVGDKGPQQKAIVTFKETKKQLVLNKTNGICVKGMFGRDTGAWIGKKITFYPAPNSSGLGDSDICIRVRGSPDLDADKDIEVKLARKSPRTVRMIKTVTKAAPAGEAPAA